MSAADRFWAKVDRSGECWLWTGSIDTRGYGHIRINDRLILAHRYAYELLRGPIPEGMFLDHLCRARACVNPDHLEPVTPGENNRRGLLGYAMRDTCRSGEHDISDPANVYVRPDGDRECRPCLNASQRRYKARKRAAAMST